MDPSLSLISEKTRVQTNYPKSMEETGWNNRIFISTDSPIVDDDVRYRSDNLHAHISETDHVPTGNQTIVSECDKGLIAQLKVLKAKRKRIKSLAWASYRGQCLLAREYLIQRCRKEWDWTHKTGEVQWKRSKPYYGNRWVVRRQVTVPFPHQRVWAPQQFRGLVSTLLEQQRVALGIAGKHPKYTGKMVKFASANRIVVTRRVWRTSSNRPNHWSDFAPIKNGHVVNGRNPGTWGMIIPQILKGKLRHRHRIYVWQEEVPYWRIDSITMNIMEKEKYLKDPGQMYYVKVRRTDHFERPDWKLINRLYNRDFKPRLKRILADALHRCAELKLQEEKVRDRLHQQMNRMSTGTSVGYCGKRYRPTTIRAPREGLLRNESWTLAQDAGFCKVWTKLIYLKALGLGLRVRVTAYADYAESYYGCSSVEFSYESVQGTYAASTTIETELRAGLPVWDTDSSYQSLKLQDAANLQKQAMALAAGRVTDSDFQFSLTRSLGELKDSKQTFHEGKDFVTFVARISKEGSVEKILQSMDARFMGKPVPATVGKLKRKLTMLKKSMPIKARKAALLADLTLGSAAALYLCNKFFVEPTASDIATVLYNGWEYVTTINKPLRTLLDTLYARGKKEADTVSLRRRWYGAERKWRIAPLHDPHLPRTRHRTIEGAELDKPGREVAVTDFSYSLTVDGATPLYVPRYVGQLPNGGQYDPYGRFVVRNTLLPTGNMDDPDALLDQCEVLTGPLRLTWSDGTNFLFDPLPNPKYGAYGTHYFDEWCNDLNSKLNYLREKDMRSKELPINVLLHEDVQGSVWIRAKIVALEDVFERMNSGYKYAMSDITDIDNLSASLHNALVSKSVPWMAWELSPLSFLVDWFITTQDTIRLLDNACNRGMNSVEFMQLPWATARSDVYYGESEYDASITGASRRFEPGEQLDSDGNVVNYLDIQLENWQTHQKYPLRLTYSNYAGRLGSEESVAVRVRSCVARRSGLYRCIRGPTNLDFQERLAALLPRVKINLNTGKVTTILALLKGMIKF